MDGRHPLSTFVPLRPREKRDENAETKNELASTDVGHCIGEDF